MYLILLLAVPPVFGYFDEIRRRQYEPAIEAQKRLDWIWENGVWEHHYDTIYWQLGSEFVFQDINGNEHDREDFIKDFLFKLNSTHPRTFDIQNLDEPRELKNSEELEADLIRAVVQWGGKYMYFEWSKVYHTFSKTGEKRLYFPLNKVREVDTKPNINNKFYKDFSSKIMGQMMKWQDIYDSKFSYFACNAETFTSGDSVISWKIVEPPTMLDNVHFYVDVPGANKVKHLVQFRVRSLSGRTHLFEVDYDSGMVLRGREQDCIKPEQKFGSSEEK